MSSDYHPVKKQTNNSQWDKENLYLLSFNLFKIYNVTMHGVKIIILVKTRAHWRWNAVRKG